MAVEHFEFLIVGGGKGGKTLAADLALAGHRTAMVERGLIGGSCINVACIPTKTMVQSAKVAELTRRAAEYGIRVNFQGVDPVGVRQRRRAVVAGLVQRNQANFDNSGMTLVLGEARFVGPRQVEVRLAQGGVRQLTGDKMFINLGTRPALVPLPGLAESKPLTSETIQELDRLPEHLIVLGGGYIGCEFAQMFRRFGSRVTLIERGPRFLPREDADIGDQVLAIFREDGIEVLLETEVRKVEGQSGSDVRLFLKSAGGERKLAGTDLLVALGRVPNTDNVNIASTGVELDARSFIKVNERLETSVPNVWALGDINGGPQFTHISLDDYRIVKANLAGGNRTTKDRLVPYTLFIDPELGRVGLTEEEARKRGLQVRVGKLPASGVARARTRGETRGLLKAVVDANTQRILGVAILAAEGGEIMAVAQMVMQAGLPYMVLRDSIFSHPSMAESLNDLFKKVE